MIQVRNQASLKGNSFFRNYGNSFNDLPRVCAAHRSPGTVTGQQEKDPWIQGAAMDGGSDAFVVQPFPEDSGAVQENVCELLGTSSSGGRRHLFPEGWSYLCKF